MTSTRTIHTLLALAAALTLQGCTALSGAGRALEDAGWARFDQDVASGRVVGVGLEPGRSRGHGAVVGPAHVLTAGHVVGAAEQAWVRLGQQGGWVEARVVRRCAAAPEDMVLLELPVDEGLYGALLGFPGFERDEWHRPSLGGEPAYVQTLTGTYRYVPALLRAGDSGSPVLDADGQLLGVLYGRIHGQAAYLPLGGGEAGRLVARAQARR